jgi:hypothetical protein
MARPIKQNAEYFPHDRDMRDDPKVKALRAKYGLEGYAVWNMLLESLCDADGFEVEFGDDLSKEVLAGDIGIASELLEEMVGYMVKLKLLLLVDGKIFSESFKKRLAPLVEKRDRDRAYRDSKTGLSTTITPQKRVFDNDNPVFDIENTQSKVKESKVKESKVNITKVIVDARENDDLSNSSFSPSANTSTVPNELPSSDEKQLQGGREPVASKSAEEKVTEWCKGNLESLKMWMEQAMYDPKAHGKCADEVAKFCGHYSTTENEGKRRLFESDPVKFFRNGFKRWLIDAKVRASSKPAKPAFQAKQKPDAIPDDPRIAFRQRFGQIADQLTTWHVDRLKQAKNDAEFWNWAEGMYNKLKSEAPRTGAVQIGSIISKNAFA